MHKNRESLPVWERGLKQIFSSGVYLVNAVAPRVGAWIETASKRGIETDY